MGAAIIIALCPRTRSVMTDDTVVFEFGARLEYIYGLETSIGFDSSSDAIVMTPSGVA